MGRRKNTAEAYEVLLRIARKQEEARRREEAKKGARGLPRAARSGAESSREASLEASADARGAPRGASRAPTEANSAPRGEGRFPAHPSPLTASGGLEGGLRASRAPEAGEDEGAWLGGLRRRPRVSGSRGLLVRRTRPRGDLALARAEPGVDPALLRRGPETGVPARSRLVARARHRTEFAEIAERVMPAGSPADTRAESRVPAGATAASGRRVPESGVAGGTAVDVLDEPGTEQQARSRLPGDAPDPEPGSGSGSGEVADAPADTLAKGDGDRRDGEQRGGQSGEQRKKGGRRRKRAGSAAGGGRSRGRRKGKASAETESHAAARSTAETPPAGGPSGADAPSGKPPAKEGEPEPAPVGSGVAGGNSDLPGSNGPSGEPASPTLEGDACSGNGAEPRGQEGSPHGTAARDAPGQEASVAAGELVDPAEGPGQTSGLESDIPSGDDLGHFDRLGPVRPPAAIVGELLVKVVLWGLAAPLRLIRWLAGDTVANALGRPVEVRPATLVMGSVALVIVLASIGIYINRHSGPAAPRFEAAPWETERPDSEKGPSMEEGAVPETSGVRETGDGGTSTPNPPADLWASPGVPSPPGPAVRKVTGAETRRSSRASDESAPGPAVRKVTGAETPSEDRLGWWIKVRAQMRRWECEDVLKHLEKVQIYLEHDLSPGEAGRSVAHKELVAYSYSTDDEGELLYWVFVGPFRQRSEADEAKGGLVELTRETLVFQNKWGTELPDYFTSAYVLADTGSISRHRWRLEGTATASLDGPPRG